MILKSCQSACQPEALDPRVWEYGIEGVGFSVPYTIPKPQIAKDLRTPAPSEFLEWRHQSLAGG